jgi:hypothetical protein
LNSLLFVLLKVATSSSSPRMQFMNRKLNQ